MLTCHLLRIVIIIDLLENAIALEVSNIALLQGTCSTAFTFHYVVNYICSNYEIID